MTTKMYARLDGQGTACSETALCGAHVDEGRRQKLYRNNLPDEPVTGYVDCSGNDVLECQVCGAIAGASRSRSTGEDASH